MSVRWEEPPGNLAPKYAEFAESLRANPGKWAVLPGWDEISPEYAVTTGIKQGRIVAFRPAGTFDSVSRKQPDGKRKTYVRYIGEGGEHA